MKGNCERSWGMGVAVVYFALEGSVEGHEKLGDIYPLGDERQNIVSSGVVLKNMTPFLQT